MSDQSATSPVTRWVRPRLEVVWSGARVGLLVGACLVLVLVLATGDRVRATTAAFAPGVLCLGLSLLAWGLSLLVGDQTTRVAADWTGRRVRRAATRGAGAGTGAMVGATVVSVAVALA